MRERLEEERPAVVVEARFRTHCVRCGGRFLALQIRPSLCEDCLAAEENR